MGSDGAHLGVSAERALETILGDKESPTAEEAMTTTQMRDWLLSAPPVTDPAAMANYDECARCVAGEILRWALANPQRYAHTPSETEITWPEKPEGGKDYNNPTYGRRGLYDVLKDEGIDLSVLEITGFMWGWAYNAARRCLELPPVPNPALLTINVE